MRILGLDPGLGATGWGLVAAEGTRLVHLGHGTIRSDAAAPLPERLAMLAAGLRRVIADAAPDCAAVEETFVNRNPASTLKLGQARGVVLLVPAEAGLEIAEYAPNAVKKAVVGVGHAGKEQVRMMVRVLLGGIAVDGADAADALAVAICHAHHAGAAAALLARRGGRR
ncbi:MAG: crossover junction endodeoxyribonuclease RuvC [Rhodothalassiaceae bacterium]|nr:MAG: crossover junction endodeoxyribonuclease RuvC [Rhodothalassiaceae bacterium]